jgi:hypothetical protein
MLKYRDIEYVSKQRVDGIWCDVIYRACSGCSGSVRTCWAGRRVSLNQAATRSSLFPLTRGLSTTMSSALRQCFKVTVISSHVVQ